MVKAELERVRHHARQLEENVTREKQTEGDYVAKLKKANQYHRRVVQEVEEENAELRQRLTDMEVQVDELKQKEESILIE